MTETAERPVRDVLLLLTAAYPYGEKETYLQKEMPFLASQFETVLIWTGTTDPRRTRRLPPNASVITFDTVDGRLPFGVQWVLWIATITEVWIALVRYRLFPRRSLFRVIRAFVNDGMRIAAGMQQVLRRRGIQPDRVVAYSYWAMETAMGCAILKALEPSIVAVTRAHGYDVYFERHGLRYRPFRRYLAQRLDRFFVVSGHGAAYTERKAGTRLNPTIQVRYLGAEGPSSLPSGAKNPGGPFTIVTCAALIPLKRIGLFIDALVDVSNHEPDLRLHWHHFGGGALQSDIAGHAARVLGGRANLSYELAGHVPHQEIEDYFSMHHVDLLVSTSQWEGLPVSMMEAMAHGIPVVSTDVGGCAEIVRDGVNGFLVSSSPTPAELGAVIRRYADLPLDIRDSFRRAAREKWERCFDVNTNYADFAAELRAIA